MHQRTNYEMTEEDLKKILSACKPTRVMFLSGGIPMGGSPQENANAAWALLGKKMGFDSETVQPIHGKGHLFFSAIPTETEGQREERLRREAVAAKEQRIKDLGAEIRERQVELGKLLGAEKP